MKRTKKYTSGFLLACLILITTIVPSCKVTRTHQPPTLTDAATLYRDPSNADTANIAALSWRQMFTDTLLANLIREGINNNLDLKVAVARIRSAAANARQSRLALLPALEANATATLQSVPSTQFGFPQAYQLYLNSSWEADIWQKLNSARRASLALLLQSEAYKRAVQTQLVADIAADYYLLLAYDAQLLITEQTVANRKAEVETVKALKESDVVTGAAVVQSAANRYSVEITLPDLRQNAREIENNLSVLLGRSPDTVMRSTLDVQIISAKLSTGIPAQLLANRPDVQQAEYQLRNSFESINVARTYFYPSLLITASSGISTTSISKFFNPGTFFANITGGLLQPVFERGINQQRLAVALANNEEDLYRFKKTVLTAGQEVSDALYSFRAASEKLSLRAEQISYLQKSVDYTKELLKYSSATNYTDVLTSEQSLLAAQLGSINDRLQQLTALVNLYRSLGGGWR